MYLEEVFIVNFTLKANNMDYDNYDNPKIAMVDVLKKKGISLCMNSVYNEILSIPNEEQKEKVIEFLFTNFQINCADKSKLAFYFNITLNKCYELFKTNIRFAELLLSTYYDNAISYYMGDTEIGEISNNEIVISLNDKLRDAFNDIFDDFCSKSTDIYQTFDILKLIIFTNKKIKNEERLACYKEIELLRECRNYFIRNMAADIYEDYVFSQSDVAKLYNDVLSDEEDDEDEDFFIDPVYTIEDEDTGEISEIYFIDVITDIATNINMPDPKSLPEEFYNDFLEHYYWLNVEEEKRRNNREYMKKHNQRVLKRINPLYMFDEF